MQKKGIVALAISRKRKVFIDGCMDDNEVSDGRTTTNKSLIQALLGTFLLVQHEAIYKSKAKYNVGQPSPTDRSGPSQGSLRGGTRLPLTPTSISREKALQIRQ